MKFYFGIVVVVSSLAILTSCNSNCVRGSGDIVTRQIELEQINGLVAYGSFEVNIKQGAQQEITATGHANVIDLLRKKVNDGIWHIDFKADCVSNLDLIINITVPDIEEVTMVGSGNINVEDFENQQTVNFEVAGSGALTLKSLDCNVLNTKIDGSGSIKVKEGWVLTPVYNTIVKGSGAIESYLVISDDCNAEVVGSGLIELTVNKTLDAIIDGSGRINYKGNPNVTKKISGSGSVNNKN